MVLVVVVNPYVLILLGPLFVAFILLRRYYLKTSREVKRLEAVSRSPVHSHVAASLDGLVTIRAFNSEALFVNQFMDHQDRNSMPFWAFMVLNRWLGFRLDIMSALFICATAFFAVLIRDSVSPALVGLSLSYSIQLMGIFQYSVRMSTELEAQMVSVERVIGYSHLPMEAGLYTEPVEKAPEKSWPHNGEIVIRDLCLTYYAGGPQVLKKVNANIRPREKIGIVGRTGSGKTSLMSCLFRLVDWEGDIVIDGIPINTIGLHDLRSKISTIPQEPTLFSGTVRRNLDPFGQRSNDELWRALGEVQLREAIQEMPGGLDALIADSGTNLSIGQRQLLCLARAITRSSRVLVMDEATANVDLDTDAVIQRTIRSRFADCTVIVVAHRLNTIMDSDRVMVMDNGRLMEFDSPYMMLQNPEGTFTKMVAETGKGMSRELIRIATEKHEQTLKDGASSSTRSIAISTPIVSGPVALTIHHDPTE
jgi:ATP-binding cassette subfamily C (CFTR/MRP) protein 4